MYVRNINQYYHLRILLSILYCLFYAMMFQSMKTNARNIGYCMNVIKSAITRFNRLLNLVIRRHHYGLFFWYLSPWLTYEYILVASSQNSHPAAHLRPDCLPLLRSLIRLYYGPNLVISQTQLPLLKMIFKYQLP